jgi:hypothetical protein
MKPFSFIIVARNDNYNCSYDGEVIDRLKTCITSIHTNYPESEVILVDWCTSGRPKLKEYFTENVRNIYISPSFNSILKNESGSNCDFYEYLGKHVGIELSTHSQVVCTNMDTILPIGLNAFQDEIDSGCVILGKRMDIAQERIHHPIAENIQMANLNTHQIQGYAYNANGDFLCCQKKVYYAIGGYRLVHTNWDVDNEFVRRASRTHKCIKEYTLFHIEHPESHTKRERPFEPKAISIEVLRQIKLHTEI